MEINRREAIMASAGSLLVGNTAKRSVNPKNLPVLKFAEGLPVGNLEIAEKYSDMPWIEEKVKYKEIPVWINEEDKVSVYKNKAIWGECKLYFQKDLLSIHFRIMESENSYKENLNMISFTYIYEGAAERVLGHKLTKIIINGQHANLVAEEISYNDICNLSNHSFCYNFGPTITWALKNEGGSLICGQKIKVQDGMVFNVAFTNKA